MSTLFELVGGRQGVARIVDAFYDRIEADAELRPIFPPNLGPGREKQKLFLEQWLGGEPRYSERYGHPRLRRRHFPFVIGEAAARRWLGHMRAAMLGCELDPRVVDAVLERLEPLALHMVNEGQDVPREPLNDLISL